MIRWRVCEANSRYAVMFSCWILNCQGRNGERVMACSSQGREEESFILWNVWSTTQGMLWGPKQNRHRLQHFVVNLQSFPQTHCLVLHFLLYLWIIVSSIESRVSLKCVQSDTDVWYQKCFYVFYSEFWDYISKCKCALKSLAPSCTGLKGAPSQFHLILLFYFYLSTWSTGRGLSLALPVTCETALRGSGNALSLSLSGKHGSWAWV